MNTLAFVNILLVKIFPTLIRQNFPPSKFYAIRYSMEYIATIFKKLKEFKFVDIDQDLRNYK